MNIIYLFSNFEDGFDKNLANSLKEDFCSINSRKKVIFIPTTINNIEINQKYFDIFLSWFGKIDIQFTEKIIFHDKLSKQEMEKHINEASLIYLCGGNTISQFNFIKDNNLISLLKDSSAILIGLSAGAINMSKIGFLFEETGDSDLVYDTFKFIDFSIIPHYTKENISLNQKINLLLKDDKLQKEKIYGIYDESAIRIKNDEVKFYNKIYKLSPLT